MIMNKETLQSVLTCLQVTQTKVRLLQEQSHLLNDELIELKNQQPMKYSELVFVQHNPLYDDNDNDDNDYDNDEQQLAKETLSESTSEVTSNEDELQEEDAKAQSDTTKYK
jgi:hypothetical protein